MFLQVHTLTSYHAALLNRDDAGLAKRIPFGNAERMRVSSQCQKHHWRIALNETLSLPTGIRSRHFFEREVFRRVVAAGIDEKLAQELTENLLTVVMQSRDAREKGSLFLKQPVLFGKPEADYFVRLIQDCAQTQREPAKVLAEQMTAHKKNFRAVLKAAGGDDLMAGIEGALFGRFVTSDILARTDASVHVAHAFTVHPLNNEVDYFTVVDDLKDPGEDAGAAHAGDMELGAGVFYGYVVIDVPLLISNLCGCDRADWRNQADSIGDAKNIVRGLVRAIATVSPGAKLGATAPYARTDFVLLETGTSQPRSLANAFLHGLHPKEDVMQQSVNALGKYVQQLDGMYGVDCARFVASTRKTDPVPSAVFSPLDQAVTGALNNLFGDL